MDVYTKAAELHRKLQGKICVEGKLAVKDKEMLSLVYSPGVAEPCRRIQANPQDVYQYTAKGNLVAVVSDGSAVLGLGNIGPLGAMPVMEGKALLFKAFAGVDGFPICLNTQDVDQIVSHVKAIAPTFGGINLEDISGPRCIEIEERLKAELDIPVFHDDQHGTAVVVFAGLINALKIVNKALSQIRVVILGAGAAGTAIAKLLSNAGVADLVVVDRQGAIHSKLPGLDHVKQQLAKLNTRDRSGSLGSVLTDADVFIGVAGPKTVTTEMVSSMAQDAVVFALANPEPEIDPQQALVAGARIVATGRSDYPNQINNVLGFPGIFRGALDIFATDITEGMKLAAAQGIAELVAEDQLTEDYIIPAPFDLRVAPKVAGRVCQAGMDEKVARRIVDPQVVMERTSKLAAFKG